MKTQRISHGKRGFTLMELMVAMAITTIIVTVLVSITSIALDTWNRSRAELRASRQAKSMLDSMARDFESLVTRRGNDSQWLSAKASTGTIGDSRLESTSASELIFFSAVTDRYAGEVSGPDNISGNSDDPAGGDVSCIAYALEYKDPVDDGASSNFETFVLNRLVVDPDVTFEKLLGKTNLETEFASYRSDLESPENFVCENIFQFSISFHVQVSQAAGGTGGTRVVTVPVTVGNASGGTNTKEFYINGNGIDAEVSGGTVTSAELAAGRISAVEISVTVITDFGIDQIKRRTFSTPAKKAEFLSENSYQYSKLVQLPSM
jgi:prepilin-type N-terminal cleavage/methylation domain-containing protein